MIDTVAQEFLARCHAIRRKRLMRTAGFDYYGQSPCIPPLALAGMVDRILLRVRVEKDDAEESGFAFTPDTAPPAPKRPAGIECRHGTTKLLFPA